MGLAIRCRNVRACHRRREFEWYFRTSDFCPRTQTVAITTRILLVGDARDVCKIGAPHETADISVWRAGWTGLAENAMSVYAPQNFSEQKLALLTQTTSRSWKWRTRLQRNRNRECQPRRGCSAMSATNWKLDRVDSRMDSQIGTQANSFRDGHTNGLRIGRRKTGGRWRVRCHWRGASHLPVTQIWRRGAEILILRRFCAGCITVGVLWSWSRVNGKEEGEHWESYSGVHHCDGSIWADLSKRKTINETGEGMKTSWSRKVISQRNMFLLYVVLGNPNTRRKCAVPMTLRDEE